MFRLSFLRHLQEVTLGYFNIQLTLLLRTRHRLHKLYIYIYILYDKKLSDCQITHVLKMVLLHFRSRDSSVGIATRYGLDGQGIEYRWGRDFPHMSRPASEAHPASYTMGTEPLSRG